MTNYYARLRASELPITWTTIRLGRETLLISADQVQSYAGDQLGRRPAETAYLVFQLFDADPTNDWEIDSLLTQLAESEYPKGDDGAACQYAEETAERTWNLLAVWEFIRNTDAPYVPAPTDDLEIESVFFFLELLANPEVCVPFPVVFDFQLPEELGATKPMYAYANSEWPLFGEALMVLRYWADAQEKLLQVREEYFLP